MSSAYYGILYLGKEIKIKQKKVAELDVLVTLDTEFLHAGREIFKSVMLLELHKQH